MSNYFGYSSGEKRSVRSTFNRCLPGGHKSIVENRDSVRGAEIETPKASMGKGIRVADQRRKLPQRGPSGAERRPKMDLVHFELERTHLTTTNSV